MVRIGTSMHGIRRIATAFAWGAFAAVAAVPAYAQDADKGALPPDAGGGRAQSVLRVFSGRLSVHVNGSYQAASTNYETSNHFPSYGEEAMFVTRQEFAGGAHVDVGGMIRLWRGLSVGAGYTDLNRSGSALVTGTVPHPLEFGRDRTAPSQALAMLYRERATHVHFAWRFALRDDLDVVFSVGPTYFNLVHGVVTNVSAREAGDPALADIDLRVRTARHVLNGAGYNVGLDATFMLTRWLGVGYFARAAAGSIAARPNPFSPDTYHVGGVQTGAGLRLRY